MRSGHRAKSYPMAEHCDTLAYGVLPGYNPMMEIGIKNGKVVRISILPAVPPAHPCG